MRVLFISTLPIPSGNASVNRILSLAKGLTEAGDDVLLLSTGKGEDTKEHEVSGIRCRNLRSSGIPVLGLLGSLIGLLKYILKEGRSIDVVQITSNSLLLLYPVWLACRLKGIKYVQEKSEFPFVLMGRNWFRRAWGKVYVNTTYKLFDGMVIMTNELVRYFQPLVRKKCKLVHIPMTVDPERFEAAPHDGSSYGDYAAYCGDMSGNKDGVLNLIEAFSYVSKSYPDFKLLMIGGTKNPDEFDRIKGRVSELGLKNVIFTGRVTRDEIPALLSSARMLCLARPSSLQSSGGFPTKLGEYLITGKPVVVTAVGDIPQYLDESNSFIVTADDNREFARRMTEVLDDYDRAMEIAASGRRLAMETFNYAVQGKRLHEFLSGFNKQS